MEVESWGQELKEVSASEPGAEAERNALAALLIEATGEMDSLKELNADLLEALRAIIQQPVGHTANVSGKDLGAVCAIARAALVKVEGGTP